MYILLSPSKTATYRTHPELPPRPLFDPSRTRTLMDRLQAMDAKTLQRTLALSDNQLPEVHAMIQTSKDATPEAAFSSFTGLVFQQLNRDSYTPDQWNYVRRHVRILDALHGVLEPGTRIRPYRLDMKAKWDIDLYEYWSDVDDAFSEATIFNLASDEFASMVSRPMITVRFLEHKNGTYKNLATYAKMGRGALLEYMILNQVEDRAGIEAFTGLDYRYDSTRSNEETIVFVRG
jgi:cytoplasmic iron level regulating protein YaaA (DUF328/UPF0246 family)